jgi:radical SAM protein with 4Fe4S-binding SPASM domain
MTIKKTETKPKKKRVLSAPIMINLELTSGCNLRCRHCYNFWRADAASTSDKVTIEKMDRLIEMIIADSVFHVVLTGGEPLLNFETLEYALRRFTECGISTSLNSNLIPITPEKARRLRDAGMDHVLTSLNSHDPATNDYMMNGKGIQARVIKGIQTVREAGIRVSANMIISEPNKNHVYETARLCASLDVQRLFATRLVPAVNVENPTETDLKLDAAGALSAIDDMVRAKEDFGIGIGTLVSYPLCVLGDLQKYRDFVGRGCPAQRGNRMCLNANGVAHACTHEEVGYGNVFDLGIKGVFKNMVSWHDGSYRYEGCADCGYIDICQSGCRSAALTYFKKMDERDPLFMGPENIRVPYRIEIPPEIEEAVDAGKYFTVPDRIRFREEDGFYTINVRWANAFTTESDVARSLMKKQARRQPLNLSDIPGPDSRSTLIYLVFKDAVEPVDDDLKRALADRPKLGCSVDPNDLPVDV